MKHCAKCSRSFPGEITFCPHDGHRLVVAETVGEVLEGQLEVKKLIGRGAMGSVYEAWQVGMERKVAVKVLHQRLSRDVEFVSRFLREAQAVARLSHPNIVGVHLAGRTQSGQPFIAMEYIDGTTLSSLIESDELDPRRSLQIVRQILAALADAHAAGIVHRDLKPGNVLLASHRRAADVVKLLDFGIAKILDADADLTREGSVFGTPAYMSPEQAEGMPVDHRSDIYSLGVVLYEMLVGELPFEGNQVQILLAHARHAPPEIEEVLPELDPRIGDIVMRCLEKDPGRRFQSADEMADAIDGVLTAADAVPWASTVVDMSDSADSFPTLRADTARPAPRRWGWAAAAVLALGLAAGGTGAYYFLGAQPGQAGATAAAAIDSGVAAATSAPGVGPQSTSDAATVSGPASLASDAVERRTIMLDQNGYTIRVSFPTRIIFGVEYDVLLDAWDPAGEPIEAQEIVSVLIEPSGRQRGLVARQTAERGRFRITRAFERAGTYVMRVIPPAGDATVDLNFEVHDPAK